MRGPNCTRDPNTRGRCPRYALQLDRGKAMRFLTESLEDLLLTTGAFDPRVDAYHAKKMTAPLQSATSADAPILLRIESGRNGLGQSLGQEIGLETDVVAFVSAQLGVDSSA